MNVRDAIHFPTQSVSAKNHWAIAGIAVFMFFLNTDIAVPIPGYYLPSAFTVAATLAAVPFAARYLTIQSLIFVIGGATCAGLSILFSPTASVPSLFLTFAQFVFALGLYVLFVDWLVGIKAWKALHHGLLTFLIVFAVGAALEKHIPAVRTASDSFRGTAYSLGAEGMGFKAYDNEDRDENSYGGVRSSFFAPEPSTVTTGAVVCGIAVILLAPSWGSFATVIACNLLVYYGTRSPIFFLGVVGFTGALFFRHPRRGMLVASLTFAGLAVASPWLGLERVQERFASLSSDSPEQSFYGRIYVPYMLTVPAVAENFPLTGAGLGAKDVINRLVPTEIGLTGDEFTLGTNGVVRIFAYMGFGLGTAFYALYLWHAHKVVGAAAFALLAFIIVGHCTGAAEVARFWGYLALMNAAFRLQKPDIEDSVEPAFEPVTSPVASHVP